MAAPKGNKYALGNKGGRPEKWTQERIHEEAQKLIEYAKRDDSLVLRKFAALQGYTQDTLATMAAKSEEFSNSLKIAKILIGSRREEKAMSGDVDTGIVKATLATYDEEHRAVLKEMKRAEREGDLMKAFLSGQQAQRELGKQD